MLAATLAIAGTPGFSGFFSKDAILLAARSGPYANPVLYWLGVLTAGLTSFYMFRLLFLTFHGAPRYDRARTCTSHESPPNMLVPLVVLAVLSVAGGWWAAPHLLGGVRSISSIFWRRSLARRGEAAAAVRAQPAMNCSRALLGAPVIAGLLGFLARVVALHSPPGAAGPACAVACARPTACLSGKYFVDELYAAVIVRPLLWISTNVLWHGIDERVIDGTVNGVGA